MVEWISVSTRSMIELGATQEDIQKWMEQNLEHNFYSNWTFKSQTIYLELGLSPEDKVRFILRWC